MNHWIGYAKSGKELDVEAELRTMGIQAEVPRMVEAIRRGKRRYAEPVVSALFPNVIAISCTDDDWHRIRTVKHLARTTYGMCEKTYLRELRPCLDAAAQEYRNRMTAIQAGQRVEEYAEGDRLRIMGGPFADQVAVFRRIIESANDIFPKLEADLELFGRISRVSLDPINARRA